ncbi:MAG: hypothetical protein DRP59_11915 [Spirochaetes bacterium]|nr:MAG: hypothetical protein DRP59_11915 [Spirochaetota bacterium]
MTSTKDVLKKRFLKLEKHYTALSDYKRLIEELLEEKDIYNIEIFAKLEPRDRAILDAYLNRFASVQDFLGAKIFPLLIDISGVTANKMTETLFIMEREEIIDSLELWIELREVRNELEHDYPEELAQALKDLKYCIDNYSAVESYYNNAKIFANRFFSGEEF